jgi:histidine triad (HIT) family protein
MGDDCLFCQIASGKTSADIVYRDEQIVAFRDINPKAPVHVLIVPKEHIDSISAATSDDTEVLGKLLLVAKRVAEDLGISKSGFRLIANTGSDGGQIVNHLHLHLLGGKHLGPKLVT